MNDSNKELEQTPDDDGIVIEFIEDSDKASASEAAAAEDSGEAISDGSVKDSDEEAAAGLVEDSDEETAGSIDEKIAAEPAENSGGDSGDSSADGSGSNNSKRSKGDIIRYIIMGVAICVFIFAAVQIVRIIRNYKRAQDIYDDINKQAYSTETGSDSTSPAIDPSVSEEYPGINASAQINFDVLKEINDDVRGWIDVPSVGISYPIVQSTDNEYYLDHAFNDEFSWSGAIFLDWKNSATIDDPHNFIYGHHMNDGSMFASLLEYDSEDFYKQQAENNNNYFYIYLEDKIMVYQIFSVCDVTFDDNVDTFRVVRATDTAFTLQDYLVAIDDVKLYDTGITADADDIITTLYTCQNGSSNPERHMVHGKLIATIDK